MQGIEQYLGLWTASAAYVWAVLAVAGVSAGLSPIGSAALLVTVIVLPLLSGLSLFRHRVASFVALPLTALLALWAIPIGLITLFGPMIVFGSVLLAAAATSLTVTLRGLRRQPPPANGLHVLLRLGLAALPVVAVPWWGYWLWHGWRAA